MSVGVERVAREAPVDPAYLQRRTLELGREAIEGSRALSDLLADALAELRAARASLLGLQAQLDGKGVAVEIAPAPPAGEAGVVVLPAAPVAAAPVVPAVVAVAATFAASDAPEPGTLVLDEQLPARPDELARLLRHRISAGLYLGTLRAGDRLPGVRDLARRTHINHKVVRRIFRDLEREALVEVRDRSGTYVREPVPTEEPHDRTQSWVTDVVVQAMERGLAADALVERVRRSTAGGGLRCACIDSVEDDRVALCREVGERFGMQSVPMALGADGAVPSLDGIDLVLTSPFHADRVRRAAGPSRPVIVVDLHPGAARMLRDGPCLLVCVDAALRDRFLSAIDSRERPRLRVVRYDDPAATLREGETGVATRAAAERLRASDPAATFAVLPHLSPGAVRRIATAITLQATPA